MAAKSLVTSTINENKDRLDNLSKEIWSNPENSFEEKHAHDILTQFLAEEGFEVERSFIYDTGFRASFGSSDGKQVVLNSLRWTSPDLRVRFRTGLSLQPVKVGSRKRKLSDLIISMLQTLQPPIHERAETDSTALTVLHCQGCVKKSVLSCSVVHV